MTILRGTKDNFFSLIKEGITLAYFSNPQTEECQTTRANLESIERNIKKDIKFVEINVNEEKKVVDIFPTIILFKNGKILKSKIGGQPRSQLTQFISPFN
ncbi:thioredoxin domain-containing protein [Priestia megaterium]|uniref:thioredoxin family protein n=1 Tax=Priestia megaterium TaxID=1404 RepID=UPI0026E2003D|nr:thioredoxin domain-containing protein [Priestia megaterium]MDO6851618.1 thioredoxin domain-containing protein [Priestia megaterium]